MDATMNRPPQWIEEGGKRRENPEWTAAVVAESQSAIAISQEERVRDLAMFRSIPETFADVPEHWRRECLRAYRLVVARWESEAIRLGRLLAIVSMWPINPSCPSSLGDGERVAFVGGDDAEATLARISDPETQESARMAYVDLDATTHVLMLVQRGSRPQDLAAFFLPYRPDVGGE